MCPICSKQISFEFLHIERICIKLFDYVSLLRFYRYWLKMLRITIGSNLNTRKLYIACTISAVSAGRNCLANIQKSWKPYYACLLQFQLLTRSCLYWVWADVSFYQLRHINNNTGNVYNFSKILEILETINWEKECIFCILLPQTDWIETISFFFNFDLPLFGNNPCLSNTCIVRIYDTCTDGILFIVQQSMYGPIDSK